MQNNDAGNQLASRPAPNATNDPGWANNDVSGGNPATILDPDWVNSVSGELLSVVAAGGQTASKANVTQVLQTLLTVCGLKGVTGSAPGSAKTASWDWGGDTYNFNGGSSGAGGWIDSASYPSSAVDLSVYRAFNPTTGAWTVCGCLGSTSKSPIYSGTPPLPAGYTVAQLLFGTVADSGGNIQFFEQIADTIYSKQLEVLAGATAAPPFNLLSIASAVPAAAKTALIEGLLTTSGVSNLNLAGDGSNNVGRAIIWGSSEVNSGPVQVPLFTPQEIYYSVSAGGTWNIYVDGWTI